MSKSRRLLGFVVLALGVLGVLGSFYLFGLKAVTTSLTRDMIGNAIWRAANMNITVYEGIEVMNYWISELSSMLDKPLLLLLAYSLVLIATSIVMIKSVLQNS